MIYLFVACAVGALAYLGWKLTARIAYASTAYTLLDSDNPFETRRYPDLLMATTNMKFESQGGDGSSKRLFQYIRGAKDDEQKVAMTTPVFIESEADDHQGQMGFVIQKT